MVVKVSITKTFQERQYEPFSITLGQEMETDGDVATVRARIYSRLEKEIDKLMKERLEKTQEPSTY